MVAVIPKHDVSWLAPSPMWSHRAAKLTVHGKIFQPCILRFTQDQFMDQLLSLLSYVPDRLPEWEADAETWREPLPEPESAQRLNTAEPRSLLAQRQSRMLESTGPLLEKTKSPSAPFKLYQPVQQRYYVVAASLVCRQAGFPDRAVQAGKQEKAGFVIRRRIYKDIEKKPSDYEEFAYIINSQGASWRNITQDATLSEKALAPNEERLPMFPLHYQGSDKRQRRMLGGLIPVGRREAYQNAEVEGEIIPAEMAALADSRIGLLNADVVSPWKELLDKADAVGYMLANAASRPSDADDQAQYDADLGNLLRTTRDQIQTSSWYVLLDFADFLKLHLPRAWDLLNGNTITPTATIAENNLATAITNTVIGSGLRSELGGTTKANLKAAMLEVVKYRSKLESVEVHYDSSDSVLKNEWPNFLFPLADPDINIATTKYPPLPPGGAFPADVEDQQARVQTLIDLVEAALPPLTAGQRIPELTTPRFSTKETWYVIRCVYERPNCGPFEKEIVSDATRPFQMASFFDPDAPARPVRIPMPLDITPAGLRKYKKNAGMMISDLFCGQLKSVRKYTLGDLVLSVLPWPFHKDLPKPKKSGPCKSNSNSLGMVCSLSIPIVTLCAMILLLIIVALFDLFFRWLPLLFTCFPIPGITGKKS